MVYRVTTALFVDRIVDCLQFLFKEFIGQWRNRMLYRFFQLSSTILLNLLCSFFKSMNDNTKSASKNAETFNQYL